jgi:hypothetical protein
MAFEFETTGDEVVEAFKDQVRGKGCKSLHIVASRASTYSKQFSSPARLLEALEQRQLSVLPARSPNESSSLADH